jgi:hypothetical protein
MKERIKLLVEQAEDWADKQNFYESDYRDYLMEKFAELIVRECDRYARSAWEHGDLLGRDLLIHFGVEE